MCSTIYPLFKIWQYLWIVKKVSGYFSCFYIYFSLFVIVAFWPSTRPKMPFKVMHRKEVTHSNGSYERKSRGWKLADEMGRAKKSHDTLIDWRTRRESELHDSYFRLMTIKRAISKIGWAIEWVLNYYIAQSRQKSRQLSSGSSCSWS